MPSITLTFSPRISDEVRANTQELFEWLSLWDTPFPSASIRQAFKDGKIDHYAQSSGGWAAIHNTTALDKKIIPFRDFLKSGAPVDLRITSDEDTQTPLDIALLRSFSNLKELVNCGANINIEDKLGYSLLHTARCFERDNKHAKKALPYLEKHQAKALATWNAWQDGTLTAAKLDLPKTMHLLNVWPLANPKGDVPRMGHLEAIFSDPRWKESDAQHKADLVRQIQGLSSREQMFLLGGATARLLMQRQAATGREAER